MKNRCNINTKKCWLVKTGLDMDGYSISSYLGQSVRTHRKIYEILIEQIPQKLVINHLCRNRNCINPSHMEPVSVKTNTNRGENACSKITHCPKGHIYDEKNTYVDSINHRHCKTCRKITTQKNAEAGYFLQWQRKNKDKLHQYYLNSRAKLLK